jgi:hypothetical protein
MVSCLAQTLNEWVKKIDSGPRAGVSAGVMEKLKALERENRELRQVDAGGVSVCAHLVAPGSRGRRNDPLSANEKAAGRTRRLSA